VPLPHRERELVMRGAFGQYAGVLQTLFEVRVEGEEVKV
jgi:hypothetical protein